MQIIELAGLPGAGKTTLQDGLCQALRAQGMPCKEWRARNRFKLSRLWHKTTTVVRHRALFAQALSLIRDSPRSRAEKMYALRLFVSTVQRYPYDYRPGGSSLAVLSEGLVQRCFLLCIDAGRPINYPGIDRYFELMPRADFIVYLDIPPVLALERLSMRPRALPARLNDLPEGAKLEVLEAGRAMFLYIMDSLARSSVTQLLTVDATNPSTILTTVTQSVAARLGEHHG